MITRDLKKAAAALLAAALVAPQAGFAADAAGPVLYQGVDVSDDHVTIKLSAPAQYNSFLTQTPPRLILDLLDVKHGAVPHAASGGGKLLAGVRSAQYQLEPRRVTRVVLDLTKIAGYKVAALAEGIGVQLLDAGAEAPAGTKAAAAPAAAPAPVPASAPSAAPSAPPAAAAAARPAAPPPPIAAAPPAASRGSLAPPPATAAAAVKPLVAA